MVFNFLMMKFSLNVKIFQSVSEKEFCPKPFFRSSETPKSCKVEKLPPGAESRTFPITGDKIMMAVIEQAQMLLFSLKFLRGPGPGLVLIKISHEN